MEPDPRREAFLKPAVEVFHTVEHQHDLWLEDPFDVREIHAYARDVFERLVVQATTPPGLSSGRILLLLGDAGSGKTHLMRAFRSFVHSEGLGYFAYMQMTTSSQNYGRYILQKVIDSLEHPYWRPQIEASGLKRLSNALAAKARFHLARVIEEGALEGDALAERVHAASEDILGKEEFQDLDANVLRALLYLQCDTVSIRTRINAYLRCERLSPFEQKIVSALAPRHQDEEPLRVVAALGRIMAACLQTSLVVCVDQFEDILNLDDAQGRFPRAMQALTAVVDEVPSSIVVIACLHDYYTEARKHLFASAVDRIEQDPAPIRLDTPRSRQEVEQLVAQRLRYLYEVHDLSFDETDPSYPIPKEHLDKLAGLSTRMVLEECRQFRERLRGVVVHEPLDLSSKQQQVDDAWLLRMTQAWNDFAAEWKQQPAETEAAQSRLLGWAIAACAEDLGAKGLLHVILNSDERIEVDYVGDWKLDGQRPRGLLVGLCNKDARGGGLGRQIEALASVAERREPVAVRSTEFPASAKALIAQQLGAFIASGGRRLVIEDAEWRKMAAFRAFRGWHVEEPRLQEWLQVERALAQLPSLRELLQLDRLQRPTGAPPRPAPEPAVEPAPLPLFPAEPEPPPAEPAEPPEPVRPAQAGAASILLGVSAGRLARPVTIEPALLRRHMALLGGTGSGKTTAALAVIESLLLQGVPALLVDRKGDLCGYARPEAWNEPLEDPALEERRRALHERLDVALYTPGHSGGRTLAISAIPRGMAEMAPDERDLATRTAAAALAGMMGYGRSQSAKHSGAILLKAIEVLGTLAREEDLTLRGLIEFIDERDPELLAAIGKLDEKNMGKLVQDLEALRIAKEGLLGAGGEPLEVEALLGLGRHAKPGRVRLSIVSTKFLGETVDVEFWAAQLLIALGRWISKHPAPLGRPQAALLLDEADLYLPAIRQPAPKQPLESLLKRARSAGLAVLLATQSPGDLDYKGRDNIRTWLVGTVKEPRALQKLEPMFTEARADTSRLAAQKPGEFHLLAEGEVLAMRALQNLVPARQVPDDEILALASGVH
jgi:energy-coupling factor transporter ATP-binding protein EcfA2